MPCGDSWVTGDGQADVGLSWWTGWEMERQIRGLLGNR